MLLDSLLKFRVAEGQQWHSLELSREDEQPQPAKGEWRGQIPKIRPSDRRKFRTGHPEKIDKAHENEPERDLGQRLKVALEVARKQQKEWDKEMKDYHDDGHNPPLPVETTAVEGDFFRQVAGPNDE